MIYIASYATMADVEAELDDPSLRDGSDLDALEQMASPQLVRTSTRMSAEWVQKCKDGLTEELRYGLEDEDGELPEMTWETDGWKELSPQEGRSNQTWLVKDGGVTVGMLVIQRVPCDE